MRRAPECGPCVLGDLDAVLTLLKTPDQRRAEIVAQGRQELEGTWAQNRIPGEHITDAHRLLKRALGLPHPFEEARSRANQVGLELAGGPSKMRRIPIGVKPEPLAVNPPSKPAPKKPATPPTPPTTVPAGSRGIPAAELPVPPVSSVTSTVRVNEDLLVRMEKLFGVKLAFRADLNYHVENFKIINAITGEEYR